MRPIDQTRACKDDRLAFCAVHCSHTPRQRLEARLKGTINNAQVQPVWLSGQDHLTATLLITPSCSALLFLFCSLPLLVLLITPSCSARCRAEQEGVMSNEQHPNAQEVKKSAIMTIEQDPNAQKVQKNAVMTNEQNPNAQKVKKTKQNKTRCNDQRTRSKRTKGSKERGLL